MELYYIIAVTDADRGEVMNALFREAGLPMILSMPGRGTAKNEHLAVYGLGETPKTVTCAVAGAQQAAQLTRAAKRRLFIDIPGNGILLTVPLKSVAGGKTLAYLTNDCKTGGTPHMEFKHELIVVILNEGYADFVMDAARAAGAGGNSSGWPSMIKQRSAANGSCHSAHPFYHRANPKRERNCKYEEKQGRKLPQ